MHLTFRKLHKWLMLLVGLQFIFWSVSGLYMVATDIHVVHGEELVNSHPDKLDKTFLAHHSKQISSVQSNEPLSINQLIETFPNTYSIKLQYLVDRPVYLIEQSKGQKRLVLMVDAFNGAPLPFIDKQQASQIALHHFSGSSDISSMTLLSKNYDAPSELSARHLPVWQVNFSGWQQPTLYISQTTGEVVTKRHNTWRVFDWMWRLHIMDYDDGENIDNALLSIVSIISLLATLTGIVLSVRWLRQKANKTNGIFNKQNPSAFTTLKLNKPRLNKPKLNKPNLNKPSLIKIMHRYLSIVIFLQIFIWISTGLTLNLMEHNQFTGNEYKLVLDEQTPITKRHSAQSSQSDQEQSVQTGFYSLNTLMNQYKAAKAKLVYVLGEPYFLLEEHRRFHDYFPIKGVLVGAQSGQIKEFSSSEIKRIAMESYSGSGKVISVTKLARSISDVSNEQNPFWQITFDDEVNTSVYIRALSGKVIKHSNDKKRVKDLMLKLHFMDYANLGSFNNWQNILFSLAFLLLNITGSIWLYQLSRDKKFLT